jgi:hypothetical protein
MDLRDIFKQINPNQEKNGNRSSTVAPEEVDEYPLLKRSPVDNEIPQPINAVFKHRQKQ